MTIICPICSQKIEKNLVQVSRHTQLCQSNRKVTVIGQSPGKYNVLDYPLTGHSGEKLAKIAGLDHHEFLIRIYPYNIFDRRPERNKNGKGDSFDLELAKKITDVSFHNFKSNKVILLGRNVAKAFNIYKDIDFFIWFKLNNAEAVIFPHTSELNALWNNKNIWKKGNIILREALNEK
jgi:uracil-DNA glycosylase